MKIALDPYMLRRVPLTELPGLVADSSTIRSSSALRSIPPDGRSRDGQDRQDTLMRSRQ